MKPNFVVKALAFLAVLTALGCSPRYYIPNTQNVPAIREQGQLNLTLCGNGNQVELQGAYGIANGFAFQATGALYIPQDESNGSGGSGGLVEGGPGFFVPIGDYFVFDTYALVGVGRMENHFPYTLQANPNTTGDISASLLRIGIQPSISFVTDYFSVSTSVRAARMDYNNIQGSLILNGVNEQAYLAANQTNYLVEPALTVRVGLPNIKLQAQAMRSFNLSNSNFKQDFALLTMGLNFNFGN